MTKYKEFAGLTYRSKSSFGSFLFTAASSSSDADDNCKHSENTERKVQQTRSVNLRGSWVKHTEPHD